MSLSINTIKRKFIALNYTGFFGISSLKIILCHNLVNNGLALYSYIYGFPLKIKYWFQLWNLSKNLQISTAARKESKAEKELGETKVCFINVTVHIFSIEAELEAATPAQNKKFHQSIDHDPRFLFVVRNNPRLNVVLGSFSYTCKASKIQRREKQKLSVITFRPRVFFKSHGSESQYAFIISTFLLLSRLLFECFGSKPEKQMISVSLLHTSNPSAYLKYSQKGQRSSSRLSFYDTVAN